MNEINEEIKLTLNIMQTEVDGTGASNELQYHLMSLLEIKRNELQQRLVERSWLEPVTHDQAPYKSVKLEGQIADGSKPLTAEELKAGGWWCADTSEDALEAFILIGLKDEGYTPWDGTYYACFLYKHGSDLLDRGYEEHTDGLKEIKRIGTEFYWSEK